MISLIEQILFSQIPLSRVELEKKFLRSKFKYDISKGKPWQYENLYAPFDFAILKEDSDKTYYVSSKDLVKTVLTFTYNNYVFTQTIEFLVIE